MGNCVVPKKEDDSSCVNSKNYLAIHPSRFHKVKRIGRGGFSLVWKVKSKTDSEVFAMKEMSKSRVVFKKCVKSVLNERCFLSILRHPLIVNMHYAFQTKDSLYLILDYMKGGDLRYTMTKTSFSETQVKFLICCILSAIEYVHFNGIIHGDIKPENLVFDERGYLRLTDFGTARVEVPNNASETAGTPQYMAPEILFRQNHGTCSDFYSIGVLMFELITSRRPFEGKNRNEIRAALSKGIPTIRTPGWSSDALDLTYKLMKPSPHERIGFNRPEEIKEHPWFREIDWDALFNREVTAPFAPQGNDNFAKEYVKKNFDDGIDPYINNAQGLFAEYVYNRHDKAI